MPKLFITVPHSLGQDDATERLREQFISAKDAYGEHVSNLKAQWDANVLNFRFTTFGATVKGSVTAEPSEVKVHANLPLMAAMFKGTIEQQIRDRLTKLLA